MHYFVSCYFYDKVENLTRKKLKNEFMERYPWVTLLINDTSFKFIDYKMINEFIKHKTDIETLTLIDSDLILPDNFRETVTSSNYDITHNCGTLIEMFNGNELYRIGGIRKDREGFSGCSFTWSKKFLESIDYKFPENFHLGGFDYLMAKICIQKKEKTYFKKLLGNNFYCENLEDFYDGVVDLNAGTNDLTIVHNYHGPRSERLTNWKYYQEYLNHEEFIEHRNKFLS